MKDHDEERERERESNLQNFFELYFNLFKDNSHEQFMWGIHFDFMAVLFCFSLILIIVVIVHPVVRSLAFCAGGDRGLQVQIPAGLPPFFFFFSVLVFLLFGLFPFIFTADPF